ncbi:hypothetical protein [Pseudomonas sp. LS-2]|uniref:hypothetical protein n=1 Tax=Pseudomonas sp. LS-2 TaxID=2315859 RepID=UPI000E73459C|nr:hypothetical protein [Pseudomonas sp. LS-2]RJX82267.1 hypothetical protein D3M70_06745 [Pseudomonas sp. LS-2]
MNKKVSLALAITLATIACGAHAGNGGSGGTGSGNPKNDSSYHAKEPVARYIWKDGKLVANPARNAPEGKVATDRAEVTTKL